MKQYVQVFEKFNVYKNKHSKSFLRLAQAIRSKLSSISRLSWLISYRKDDGSPEMELIFKMIPNSEKKEKFLYCSSQSNKNAEPAFVDAYINLTNTKFQFKNIQLHNKVFVYYYEHFNDYAAHKFNVIGDFTYKQFIDIVKQSTNNSELKDLLLEASALNNSKSL